MSTSAHATTETLTFAPYIFFYGRCEEALAFYKTVFGGTYEFERVGQTPMADQVPPDRRDRVMHGTFTAPGITFMASDGQESKAIDPEEGNIALSVAANDVATGDRVFNALAQGGTIKMPLAAAFWGQRFGIVNDRFGIEWMVVSP